MSQRSRQRNRVGLAGALLMGVATVLVIVDAWVLRQSAWWMPLVFLLAAILLGCSWYAGTRIPK